MANTRSLTDFRAALIGSGSRPNLFRVELTFPVIAGFGVAASTAIPFLVEATELPGNKIGEIELGFMGRKTYYPGDREFDPWTITVINDENSLIHDAFETWMSGLNSHVGNIRDPRASVPSGYSADGKVFQLSKIDGPPTKAYKMTGSFPTEVSAIELDWNTPNTIEKFKVTFRYQWWEATGVNGPTTDGSSLSLVS